MLSIQMSQMIHMSYETCWRQWATHVRCEMVHCREGFTMRLIGFMAIPTGRNVMRSNVVALWPNLSPELLFGAEPD
ncbi:MAG: hypothetical protein CMJ19_10075 [Phycisphaeraceae bacterium]|nr:hypothetical protein [Phycisphaeraceae bacterium]